MLVHLLLELSNPALYYLVRKIHQMLTVVPEIGPTESLGEYVSVLLNRSHVLYRNLASLEKFTNKVETYIDMLASGGAQRILDQCLCPLIVLKDLLYLPHTFPAQLKTKQHAQIMLL